MKGTAPWTDYAIAAAALVFALGCSPGDAGGRRPREESAGATATTTAKIPITTTSADARQDFIKGRQLAENLRLHDSRELGEIEKQYTIAARSGDTVNMAADAIAMGDILLQAEKPDPALRRYDQALGLIQGSGLSPEVKANARLVYHLNAGRAALTGKDLKTATAEVNAFMQGAATKNSEPQMRQAPEFLGAIALREKQFDRALQHLNQANQQDPYVLYSIGLAYQGKGDGAKAREMLERARDHNTLPTLNHAFARAKIRNGASIA